MPDLELRPRKQTRVAVPARHSPAGPGGLGSGWITYAQWDSPAAVPITEFSTTWIVPEAPVTDSGQEIYIYNGAQYSLNPNNNPIIQPVLQWGVMPHQETEGGAITFTTADSWSVASYFYGGPTPQLSGVVQVNPGDSLTGVITQAEQAGNEFTYTCEFSGMPTTKITVENIPQLLFWFETLECYGLTRTSDYPAAAGTRMTSISIASDRGTPGLIWAPQFDHSEIGETTSVISNSPQNGEVDISYVTVGLGVAPGLTVVGEELLMAWKGAPDDDRIWTARFDGQWSAQQQIPGVGTSGGPALEVFGGDVYCIWKGEGQDPNVWWTRSTDGGETWQAQQPVPGIGASGNVAICALRDKLFAAWKGAWGDETIWWTTFDGTNWAPQQYLENAATSAGPALAVCEGVLYCVWKGVMDYDQRIWWSTFNGSTWAPQQQLPNVGTNIRPALAAYGDLLFAAWKGADGDEGFWWSSFDGNNWSPQTNVPDVGSSVGPALTVFNGELFAAWKGGAGDVSIWWSTSKGGAWSAQKEVPGVGTSPDTF